MPLTYAQCRLVESGLVDRYNALETQFDAVSARLPKLARSKKYGVLRKELAEIADLLQREAYRVGFLGLSQVGKSSALNHALGSNVLPVGKTEACTSAVIRTRFVPPDQPPECKIVYLSQAAYESRRLAVGKLLGFFDKKDDTGAELTDDELIEKLRPLLQRGSQQDEFKEDREYFLRLLESYRACGAEYVRPKSLEEVRGPYADATKFRSDLQVFAQHPDRQSAQSREPRFTLIQEIQLRVPTEEFDTTVELIDLPGLGAKIQSDDALTLGFLRQLDGAFVFENSAANIKTREGAALIAKLKERFRNPAGRLWLVITKVDSLTRESVHGDQRAGTRTFWDTVESYLQETDLNPDNAMLVSNRFYEERQRAVAAGQPVEALVRSQLLLDMDAHGEPILPDVLKRRERLGAAYREVARDGGISRLRERIKNQVAKAVRDEVAREIAQRLRELIGQFQSAVQEARALVGMRHEDFGQAMAWSGVVQEMHDDLRTQAELLRRPADDLRQKLWGVLNQVCSRRALPAPEDFPKHHSAAAKLLAASARVFVPAAVKEAFDGLVSELTRRNRERLDRERRAPDADPLLPVFDAIGELRASWEAFGGSVDCYEDDVRSFEAPDLFAGKERIESSEYRQMLERKLNAVVYTIAHRLRNRIRSHLKALQRRLWELGSSDGQGDDVDRQVFDEIIERLQALAADEPRLGSVSASSESHAQVG